MTRRISRRALVVMLLGAVLLAFGSFTVANGLAERYASARSAITIHHQKPPKELDEYTYYSFESGGTEILEENLSSVIDDISALLLSDAEASGSFEVPQLDVYVDDTSLVAVAGRAPGFGLIGYGSYFRPWTPHAYMILPFIGTVITFAGLFWLAARWHLTASARRREIDETPL